MVGAFLCLERSGLFLCPFFWKEVSAVANRIIRCGGKALTRCRSKVHDTFDTIQHAGGFPSGHRHIVHGIRSLGCRELGLRTHLTSLCRSLSKSSPVAPDTAATWLIEESKSDAVFTAATPRTVTAAEAGRNFSPAEETLSPADFRLSPAVAIFCTAVAD